MIEEPRPYNFAGAQVQIAVLSLTPQDAEANERRLFVPVDPNEMLPIQVLLSTDNASTEQTGITIL